MALEIKIARKENKNFFSVHGFLNSLTETFVGYCGKYLHPDKDALSSREKDRIAHIIDCAFGYDEYNNRIYPKIEVSEIIRTIDKEVYCI